MARSPGPIPIAPHVARVLRLARAMRSVDAADAKLRADGTARAAATLPTRLVQVIEDELEVTLPDDLVALAACAVPAVRCASGLALADTLDAQAFAEERDRARDELVALATVSGEPFAERDDGAHGGPLYSLCIRRDAPRDGRTMVTLVESDRHELHWVAIDDLIVDAIATRYRDDPAWLEVLAAARALEVDPADLPALVGEAAAAATPAAARRVRHPTFGEGTVARELDGGKLEIAFDTAGKKVLLARFVADA